MITYITSWGNQFIEDRFIASEVKISSLYEEFYIMDWRKIEEDVISKSDIVFLGMHYFPNRGEIADTIETLNKLGASPIFIPTNDNEILRLAGDIQKLSMETLDTSVYQEYSSRLIPNVSGLKEYHPVDKILQYKDEKANNTITVNFQHSSQSVTALLTAQKVSEEERLTVLAFDLNNFGLLEKCPNVLPIAPVSSDWIYQLIARSKLLIDFDSSSDNRFKIAANLLQVPCVTNYSNNELPIRTCIDYIKAPQDLEEKYEYAKTLDVSIGKEKIKKLC